MTRRHILAFVLKAVITAALLSWLLLTIDMSQIGGRLQGVFWPTVVLVIALLLGQTVLAAVRWRAIMGKLIRWNWVATTRVVMVGQFFNQILPSTIGGDVIRGWYAHRAGLAIREAVVTVILDRVIGLQVLAVLVVAMSGALRDRILDPTVGFLLLASGSAILIATVIIAALDAVLRNRDARIIRLLVEMASQLRTLMMSPRRYLYILAVSAAIHGITIISIFLLADALSLRVSLLDMALIVPPVMVLSMLPISLGGWGVREGAMVIGLSQVGVPGSESLILSLLFGLVITAAGMVGGLVWLLDRHPPGFRVKGI